MCSTFYGGSSSHTRWPSTSSLRFTPFASGPGTGVFVSFTTSSVRTNTYNQLRSLGNRSLDCGLHRLHRTCSHPKSPHRTSVFPHPRDLASAPASSLISANSDWGSGAVVGICLVYVDRYLDVSLVPVEEVSMGGLGGLDALHVVACIVFSKPPILSSKEERFKSTGQVEWYRF